MGDDGEVSTITPTTDPLDIVALDVERHVAAGGWDQPHRLFALVRSADLIRDEPRLADAVALSDHAEGALSAVEQEDLPLAPDLESLLAQIAWPDAVVGAALAVERIVIPPEAERDLPAEPGAALAHLAAHPDRRDVRLVVAVSRDGRSCCLLRQRAHDADDRVARGSDIAPGLVHALHATLSD